jgi:hypothetical protein
MQNFDRWQRLIIIAQKQNETGLTSYYKCLSENAQVDPHTTSLTTRKTFNRSILKPLVSTTQALLTTIP